MVWWGHTESQCAFTVDCTELDGETEQEWCCPHGALEGKERCPFHCQPEDVPDSVDVSEAFLGAFFARCTSSR